MELGQLTTQQVHNVARFYAAAEAVKHGHSEVQIRGKQTYLLIDGRTVQVSSRRQVGSPWQMFATRPVHDGAAAVIFVDLTGDWPDFYLAPATWVKDDVRARYEAWLEAKGGRRPRNPKSDHYGVKQEHILKWHQRWSVLDSLE